VVRSLRRHLGIAHHRLREEGGDWKPQGHAVSGHVISVPLALSRRTCAPTPRLGAAGGREGPSPFRGTNFGRARDSPRRQRERRCGGNVQHGSTGKTRPPQPRCSQQPPRAPAAFLCGLRWTITHCEYGLRACVFCGRAAPQERPRALHQAAEPGAAKGIPGVCWLARAAACLRVRVRVRACACSDTHAGCLIVVRDTRAGARARMCACCAGWCRVRA
jgi:hypothetical protein